MLVCAYLFALVLLDTSRGEGEGAGLAGKR